MITSLDPATLYPRWCSETQSPFVKLTYFWAQDEVEVSTPEKTRKAKRPENYRYKALHRDCKWVVSKGEVGTESDDPRHAGKTLSKNDRKDIKESLSRQLGLFRSICFDRQDQLNNFIRSAEKVLLREWNRGPYDFCESADQRRAWFCAGRVFVEERIGDRIWFDVDEEASSLREAQVIATGYAWSWD